MSLLLICMPFGGRHLEFQLPLSFGVVSFILVEMTDSEDGGFLPCSMFETRFKAPLPRCIWMLHGPCCLDLRSCEEAERKLGSFHIGEEIEITVVVICTHL